MKRDDTKLRVPLNIFGINEYWPLVWMCVWYGITAAVLILGELLRVDDRIVFPLVTFLFLLLYLSLILPLFFSVSLYPERIELCLFGIVLWTLPVDTIQGLYVVGDWRSIQLCFSTKTLEELAEQRERALAKGIFTKHELPFRKRQANWHRTFAKEQLVKRNSIHQIIRSKACWMAFDPAVVMLLRRQYPQIPIVSLCGIESDGIVPQPTDRIPYADLGYRVTPEPDGLHIMKRKQPVRHIPSERLRTILRVDQFTPWRKGDNARGIYLVAAMCSVEELAELGRIKLKRNWKAKLIDKLSVRDETKMELFALAYCERKIQWWTQGNERICPMYYTPEKAQQLRQLYPNARWIDVSEEWAI